MPQAQVQFASDGFTIQGFLARPNTADKPLPAILIIHEWWGLTEHIKDIAKRFAKEGFVALAPELYSRQGYLPTTDAAEAAKRMSALSSQALLRDLNAAAAFLKQQQFVLPYGLGVVGFCMGGTYALTQACHNSDLKAAVVFYGKVPPIETFRYLLCPVLYHYGAQDDWVTKQEVDTLKDGLAKTGKPGEVKNYPNAGHAFFNDTRPQAYRADEARQAWQTTLTFFRRYVR
jgi:carboxymethylenebutenolidase